MNTSPSIDDLLEGVIKVLGEEVPPAVTGAKPQASTAMAMSLLQTVRQLLPVYDEYLVEEHNDMISVLADTAAALGNDEIAALSPDDVAALAEEADRPEAQAVVLSCTDMRAAEAVVAIERRLGKPVVTSNQAMMHAALKRLGIPHRESVIGEHRLARAGAVA